MASFLSVKKKDNTIYFRENNFILLLLIIRYIADKFRYLVSLIIK